MNMDQRIALIKQQPVFSLLTPEDIHELAELMDEVVFPAEQVIVHEGDAVDVLYIIAEGTAKVARTLSRADKTHHLHIKMLYPSESIGFSAEGLFSATGLRMSTVVAQTKVICLAVSLLKLYEYFGSAKLQYPDLKKHIEEFLVTNFIIKTELFPHLTKDKIDSLRQYIKKVQLTAGSSIYRAGEARNYGYYILSGEVQLQEENNKRVLRPGALFGKLARFDHYQDNNSSAVCLNHCELLMIDRKSILAYKQKNKSTTLLGRIKKFFSGDSNGYF